MLATATAAGQEAVSLIPVMDFGDSRLESSFTYMEAQRGAWAATNPASEYGWYTSESPAWMRITYADAVTADTFKLTRSADPNIYYMGNFGRVVVEAGEDVNSLVTLLEITDAVDMEAAESRQWSIPADLIGAYKVWKFSFESGNAYSPVIGRIALYRLTNEGGESGGGGDGGGPENPPAEAGEIVAVLERLEKAIGIMGERQSYLVELLTMLSAVCAMGLGVLIVRIAILSKNQRNLL